MKPEDIEDPWLRFVFKLLDWSNPLNWAMVGAGLIWVATGVAGLEVPANVAKISFFALFAVCLLQLLTSLGIVLVWLLLAYMKGGRNE
jgi:hypothetical protein